MSLQMKYHQKLSTNFKTDTFKITLYLSYYVIFTPYLTNVEWERHSELPLPLALAYLYIDLSPANSQTMFMFQLYFALPYSNTVFDLFNARGVNLKF